MFNQGSTSPGITKLIEGTLAGKSAFIAVERTSSGGRGYVYSLDGTEVTREVFIVAIKFADVLIAQAWAADRTRRTDPNDD